MWTAVGKIENQAPEMVVWNSDWLNLGSCGVRGVEL